MIRFGSSSVLHPLSSILSNATRAFSSKLNKVEHIVIIGSGWGGYNAACDLASSRSRGSSKITVVSPSNHFLFTPLLPSTATGTLEFRAIQEPVRAIQNVNYFQAKARSVDFESKTITCDGVAWSSDPKYGSVDKFEVKYDKLIIAAGVKTNTFNTPLVEEREEKEVFFLKHLHHARGIRDRTIEMVSNLVIL
jgi:NADH dehydrogenase FAD-containing subunit